MATVTPPGTVADHPGPGVPAGAGPSAERVSDDPRRPVLAPLAAAGTLALMGGVLHTVDPSAGPTLCPLRALTGLACPGCGTTRMLHHLLHGDLGTAFAYNPLTFLLVPVALLTAFTWLTRQLGGPSLWAPRVPARLVWVFVAVVAAYGVARNVPIGPLQALGLPA